MQPLLSTSDSTLNQNFTRLQAAILALESQIGGAAPAPPLWAFSSPLGALTPIPPAPPGVGIFVGPSTLAISNGGAITAPINGMLRWTGNAVEIYDVGTQVWLPMGPGANAVTVSGDTQLDGSADIVSVDASAAATTISLPDWQQRGMLGRTVLVTKADASANLVHVAPTASTTINGLPDPHDLATQGAFLALTLVGSGWTTWLITGHS